MAGKQYKLNQYSAPLKSAIDSGITSGQELANIMGNAHVETWGFSTMHESFRYRSVAAVLGAVSSADDRFTRTQLEAAVASREPDQIATVMYENRKDLGNTEPGDGWRFHGRGFFQYTGRDNYASYGRKFGIDLVGNPELAADPRTAAQLAVSYWQDKVPADKRQDVRAAARVINGGDNGMAARINAARQWEQVLTPQLIADMDAGEITPEQFPTASQIRDPAGAVSKPLTSAGLAVDLPEGLLQLNSSGAAVSRLQLQLDHLGYHDAQGRALKADGDFGARTREALQAFQRDQDLKPDGIAGPKTQAALQAADQQLLTHPKHPHHGLFRNAMEKVHGAEFQRHITPGPHSERLAAALTVEAICEGLARIDRVELNDRGTLARAVQVHPLRDEAGLNRSTDGIGTQQGSTQSILESSQQVQQVANLRLQQAAPQRVLAHDALAM